MQWLNHSQEVDECVFWCLSRANLGREIEELKGLFFLLKHYLKRFKKELIDNKTAFLAIGEIYLLPKDIQKQIAELEDATRQFMSHRRLGLWLAYDRDYDLIRATHAVIKKYPDITDPKEIESHLGECGYAKNMRNPTVLVRTGAKKWNRTSGAFMGRETEIHFTETLWPDFSLDSLKKLIEWVKKKEHTYGL